MNHKDKPSESTETLVSARKVVIRHLGKNGISDRKDESVIGFTFPWSDKESEQSNTKKK